MWDVIVTKVVKWDDPGREFACHLSQHCRCLLSIWFGTPAPRSFVSQSFGEWWISHRNTFAWLFAYHGKEAVTALLFSKVNPSSWALDLIPPPLCWHASSIICLLLFLSSAHACARSRVWLFAIPCTVPHWAPLCMEFPRQEYWTGLPFKGLVNVTLEQHFLHEEWVTELLQEMLSNTITKF